MGDQRSSRLTRENKGNARRGKKQNRERKKNERERQERQRQGEGNEKVEGIPREGGGKLESNNQKKDVKRRKNMEGRLSSKRLKVPLDYAKFCVPKKIEGKTDMERSSIVQARERTREEERPVQEGETSPGIFPHPKKKESCQNTARDIAIGGGKRRDRYLKIIKMTRSTDHHLKTQIYENQFGNPGKSLFLGNKSCKREGLGRGVRKESS